MEELVATISNMTDVLERIDTKLDNITSKVQDVDHNLLGSFDSLRGLGLNNTISDLYQILCSIGYDITEMKNH